jgi:flagellar protein FlaG
MEIQQVSAPGVVAQATPAQRESAPAPAAAVAPAAAPAQASPKHDDVKQAVKEIQTFVNNVTTNVQFSVDQDTGRTIVSVIDTETKQIVRQIPTQDVMKIARALDRMQGILFSGKA